MKTKMFFATLALLLCSFVSSTGSADDRLYIEDGFPISKCIPPQQSEAVLELQNMVKTAVALSKCGNYEASMSYLQESLSLVAYLAETNKQPIQTKLGRCFAKKNCKRRISAQKVTKKHCKATLLGASWQQVHPKVGKCKNI